MPNWLEKKVDQERLFKVGYDAGKRLLTALQKGEISKEDVESEIPVGVLLTLGGPTNEFILGRIFAWAQDHAFSAVVERDEKGLPRTVNDWVTDKELKKAIARNKFSKGNCNLLD